jgi:hypothetical protein
VSAPDARPRRPLTPAGLFQLVCDEALQDGRIEEWEGKLLNALARFLGLSREAATEAAKASRRRYLDGKLGRERPLRGTSLYRKVLYFTVCDGRLDRTERALLQAIRKLFQIDEETHGRIFHQIADHFRRRAPLPEPPPATPPPMDPELARLLLGAREFAFAAAEGREFAPEPAVALMKAILDRPERPFPAPLVEAAADLAAPLAKARLGKWLTTFLLEGVDHEDTFRGAPGQLSRLLQGWAHAVTGRGEPEEVRGLEETFWALLHHTPPTPARWAAWSHGTFHLLKGLASAEQWEDHVRVLRRFEQVPEARVQDVAASWAESAADWVALGMHAGQDYAVDRGLQELKRLASFRDQPGVRRAEASALACAIDGAAQPEAFDEARLLATVKQLRELVRAYPEDCRVAGALARVGGVAGEALVQLADDRETARELLFDLEQVAVRELLETQDAEDLAWARRRLSSRLGA